LRIAFLLYVKCRACTKYNVLQNVNVLAKEVLYFIAYEVPNSKNYKV